MTIFYWPLILGRDTELIERCRPFSDRHGVVFVSPLREIIDSYVAYIYRYKLPNNEFVSKARKLQMSLSVKSDPGAKKITGSVQRFNLFF